MPNYRKHHEDRPATGAERVAAHRAKKREAERNALEEENSRRFRVELQVADQVDTSLDFLTRLYAGDGTELGEVVGLLTRPEVKHILRRTLVERKINDPEFQPALFQK